MNLDKFTSLELTELNHEELRNTNGGIIPLLIIAGVIWVGNTARVAATCAIIAGAVHTAKDGFDAGYKSAH